MRMLCLLVEHHPHAAPATGVKTAARIHKLLWSCLEHNLAILWSRTPPVIMHCIRLAWHAPLPRTLTRTARSPSQVESDAQTALACADLA